MKGISVLAHAIGVFLLFVANNAGAQPALQTTNLSYQITPAAGGGGPRTVNAKLIVPAIDKPVPAVILLHSSGGINASGAYHGKALNAAGIATLEIDMFPRGGRPTYLEDTVPHVLGGLNVIAERPEIDAARIGTMGFSWGGGVSILLLDRDEAWQPDKPERRFAAHVAFYPTCYVFQPAPRRRERQLSPTTGAPLLILIGDKDNYEPASECVKFPQLLQPEERAQVTVHVFPGATHSWDIGKDEVYRDSAANMGRGGEVVVRPNAAVAEQSRAMSVAFFKRAFGMAD